MKNSRLSLIINKKIVALAVIGLASMVYMFCTSVVGTGKVGVLTTFGKIQPKYLNEGLHVVSPFTLVHDLNIREQKLDEESRSYTRDIQQTAINVVVGYRVKTQNIIKLYQTIGDNTNIEDLLVLPVIRKSIKSEIGKWKATELIAHREKASNRILKVANSLVDSRYIEIMDVSITYIKYNDTFEKAIEDKQIATQEAIKAKNMTVKIKEEANQKVITAKAEAQAMKIKSQALSKNKNLVAYEFVQKWDGKLPQVTGNDIMPILDLGKSLKSSSKDEEENINLRDPSLGHLNDQG